MNELEVVGLRRPMQNRLEHWLQLRVPAPATHFVDLVPNALLGSDSEH